MMMFGAVVVIAYTLVGGYLSVVATDFIQGCLMFFALAVVLIGSIASVGGVDVTVAFLQNIPGFLNGGQLTTPIMDAATGLQAVQGDQPLFGRAYRFRHPHHHLHLGLGPWLLRDMAAGARTLPGHPLS